MTHFPPSSVHVVVDIGSRRRIQGHGSFEGAERGQRGVVGSILTQKLSVEMILPYSHIPKRILRK